MTLENRMTFKTEWLYFLERVDEWPKDEPTNNQVLIVISFPENPDQYSRSFPVPKSKSSFVQLQYSPSELPDYLNGLHWSLVHCPDPHSQFGHPDLFRFPFLVHRVQESLVHSPDHVSLVTWLIPWSGDCSAQYSIDFGPCSGDLYLVPGSNDLYLAPCSIDCWGMGC